MTKKFAKKHTTIMFRVEEIEQTNTVVHLKWKLKGFNARKFYFKLLRSRSLGEYVTFYTSSVQDMNVAGVEWPCEFKMKDICRNDPNRSLRIEIWDYEKSPHDDLEVTKFLAEFSFTLGYIKRHVGAYMGCFTGKFMHGMIKVVSYDLSYEF